MPEAALYLQVLVNKYQWTTGSLYLLNIIYQLRETANICPAEHVSFRIILIPNICYSEQS